MRVVIFGATGKLGQELVPYLIDNDPDICVTAVGHRKENIFALPRVEYVSCDIEEGTSFAALPERADAVINLAAAVTTRVNSSDVHAYVSANIVGAVNILDYSVKAGAERILYAQTYNDVFGNPDIGTVIHPDTPRKSRYTGEAALYAITKNAAVDLAHYYQDKYGIKVFTFRLPTVHICTQSPYYLVAGKKRVRPIRRMMGQAAKGEPIEIWGDPNHVMDMVYVADFCQMFHLGLRAQVNGGTYNVGTGVGTTLQQQVEGMIQVFSPEGKQSPIIYRPDKPNGRAFIMDIENARRELGYEPKYTYLDMLREFKTRLGENIYTPED